jgi:hypothetical protein
MQTQDDVGDRATNMFSTIVGVLMSLIAVLLTIPITTMLLLARDTRDMTGGIAGAVLVVFMLLTGVVLVLREKAPAPIMRAFYFGIGGVSLVSGVGVFCWGIYCISTGAAVQKRALAMPLLFIAVGVEWIRRGFNVRSSAQRYIDAPPVTQRKAA